MNAALPSRGLWRRGEAIIALLAITLMLARGQSDSAQAPDSPAPGSAPAGALAPFLPNTNAVSSSFLDSHPELESSPTPLPAPTTAPASPSPSHGVATATASLQPEEDSGDVENGRTHFAFPQGSPDELADHLLVVYNSADPDSKSLADYYAGHRQIPGDRVLGIPCPLTEEITRQQYEKTVHEPILSYILHKDWMERRPATARINGQTRDLLVASRNTIWAIVLMRGMPLRIAQDPTIHDQIENFAPLTTNAAAVDSELAMLPVFGLPPGGFVPNPFFDRAESGLVRAGPELATKIVLVTRLDGPQPADVRRMIDDSIYAENNRLAGLAVIDTRGIADGTNNTYAIGDDWLRSAREMLQRDGWTVKYDVKPEVLPASDPLNHVAIYLGWYHAGACGPWITGPSRFVRGAIAYHLHSFSATTVRYVGAGWVAPLIAHGAAATMGCVYEPYLDLTPHLDIFTKRLLQGNSFAEAAYASQRGLSWMVTVVGDPLYRPFSKSLDSVLAGDDATNSDHHGWLLLQQVKRGIVRKEIPEELSALEHYLDIPGAVVQEGLGDTLSKIGDPTSATAAVRAYREAANLDNQSIDRIRVGLKLAQEFDRQGDRNAELEEFSTLRDLYPAEAIAYAVPGPPGSGATNSATSSPYGTNPAPNPTMSLAPPKPPRPPQPTRTLPISENP